MNLPTFSAVMILCSVCNVIGIVLTVAFDVPPPNMFIWLGSWISAATLLSIVAAH